MQEPISTRWEVVDQVVTGSGTILRFDLTAAWHKILASNGFTAEEKEASIAYCNTFRVFELLNGKVRFRVAAIFMAPQEEDGLMPEVPNAWLSAAEKLLWDFERDGVGNRPACATISVIGSTSRFDADARPNVDSRNIQIFCTRALEDSQWAIRLPDLGISPVWYGFVRHLLPMSQNRRLALLRAKIEEIMSSAQNGWVTLPKLAESLGLPEALVRMDVEQLIQNGECRYAKVDGKTILECTGGGARRQGWLISLKQNLLYGLFDKFIVMVFLVLGCCLLLAVDDIGFMLLAICVLAVVAYVGNLLTVGKLRKTHHDNQ